MWIVRAILNAQPPNAYQCKAQNFDAILHFSLWENLLILPHFCDGNMFKNSMLTNILIPRFKFKHFDYRFQPDCGNLQFDKSSLKIYVNIEKGLIDSKNFLNNFLTQLKSSKDLPSNFPRGSQAVSRVVT